MVSEDDLRDRIEYVLHRTAGADWHETAQAIIDEFDLTVRGDDCGYHEIHGSYDTRFGKWEER